MNGFAAIASSLVVALAVIVSSGEVSAGNRVAATDPADDAATRAAEYRRRGAEAYRRGEFERAAEQFKESYRVRASTDVLFAWAQSARRAGDCTLARRLYRRFVAKSSSEVDVRAAESGLAECAALTETRGDEETSSAPVAPVASPEAEPAGRHFLQATTDDGSPGRWYRDPWGATLVGGGAVLAAIGLGYVSSGNSLADGVRGNATHDVVTRAENSARRRRIIGAVAGIAGVAAIAAGVLRYQQVRRRRDRTVTLQPMVGGGAVGGLVGGTF